jgi:hypothetical protein
LKLVKQTFDRQILLGVRIGKQVFKTNV